MNFTPHMKTSVGVLCKEGKESQAPNSAKEGQLDVYIYPSNLLFEIKNGFFFLVINLTVE